MKEICINFLNHDFTRNQCYCEECSPGSHGRDWGNVFYDEKFVFSSLELAKQFVVAELQKRQNTIMRTLDNLATNLS